jgi:hypothetical protein
MPGGGYLFLLDRKAELLFAATSYPGNYILIRRFSIDIERVPIVRSRRFAHSPGAPAESVEYISSVITFLGGEVRLQLGRP